MGPGESKPMPSLLLVYLRKEHTGDCSSNLSVSNVCIVIIFPETYLESFSLGSNVKIREATNGY